MEALSYCQLMERCLAAEARVVEVQKRIAELESCGRIEYTRRLERRISELEARTVKLPPRVDCSNVPFAAHTWNCCIDEVESCLTTAGIKWEAE